MGEIHELFVLALSLVWFAGATPDTFWRFFVWCGPFPPAPCAIRWKSALDKSWSLPGCLSCLRASEVGHFLRGRLLKGRCNICVYVPELSCRINAPSCRRMPFPAEKFQFAAEQCGFRGAHRRKPQEIAGGFQAQELRTPAYFHETLASHDVGFGNRKGTPKNFCGKDFAGLSGELSGAIYLKPLFYWVMATGSSPLELFRKF